MSAVLNLVQCEPQATRTVEESSLAATALRVAGLTPVLEYRTGRVQ